MPASPDYDLVIHNGLLYDGGGGAPYVGGVAVQGDRLALVGPLGGARGRVELDAGGLALAPGDTVHLMATKAQIPVGAATKEANAPTVFAVNEGPALVELDGTSACRINLVAGEYS